MGLTRVEGWFSDKQKCLGRAFAGLILLGAVTTTMQAAMTLDLRGCKASADNGYRLESVQRTMPPQDYMDMYFCDESAFVQGNMKLWSELDLVPHHIVLSNNTGSFQDFTFRVGGDYKDNSNPNLVGWDYISELTLDENATRVIATADGKNPDTVVAACRSIGDLATQEIQIGADQIDIYREVVVSGFHDDLTCVAIYNMRLAIGSNLYHGSTLQSRLLRVAGDINVGAQTLSVESDEVTAVSKTMTAARGALSRAWSVTKSSSPSKINFVNTCDESLLEQDVNITITWTKGELTGAGTINVTTNILASNFSRRDFGIEVVDTLYSGEIPIPGNELAENNCSTILLANTSGTVCTFDFTIDDEGYTHLNDVAEVTFIDPFINEYEGYEAPTRVATETQFIQTSQGGDENATIKDHEWISGNNLNYAVAYPGSGSFDNYTAGTVTNDDVNWTSDLVTDDGSVTFTKTVYAGYATDTVGTLGDVAILTTGGGSVSESGPLSITLNVNRLASLTVTKEMNAGDIPAGETLDFNFTVVDTFDNSQIITLEVNQSQPSQSFTITGLTPGYYGVSEHAKIGYSVVGDSVREVNLTQSCAETVVFTNEIAGRPGVIARKVTYPASIDGVQQYSDWNMTLYKWNDINASWEVFQSNLTDATGRTTLVEPDSLLPGTYKIEEMLKEGWYGVGRQGSGCEFTYVIDENQSDLLCVFANEMYGQIIINKAFVEGSDAADFNFTQDINSSDPLVLGDVEITKTYLNLKAGQYWVTEEDAKLEGHSPSYDLTGLVCTEHLGNSDGDNNTTTDLLTRTAIIDLDPGEVVECTFTNRERGRINVVKTEDGNETTRMWRFTLQGEEGIIEYESNTSGGGLDFSDARLQPEKTYRLCEIYVEAGWSAEWFLDDINITEGVVLRPHEDHIDRCYDFNVSVGETARFVIDNISPPVAGIDIEKFTNGEDADAAPGPYVATGSTVYWEYNVTNTGDINLTNITVVDDPVVTITCPKTVLGVGESMLCTASGTAVAGQYENNATVTATAPDSVTTVTDSDLSHYFAETRTIDIEKHTNGEDADTATGPRVAPDSDITWTYIVTNTSNVTLYDINVTDDMEGFICNITSLEAGESDTCEKNGTAIVGQYANIGTVTAVTRGGGEVSDSDPSHYIGDPDCPCEDVKSDSSPSMNQATGVLMMLMTIMLGLFFVRREEQFKSNKR